MTTISPAAEAARESSRTTIGQFGNQPHQESGVVEAPVPGFYGEWSPDLVYPAVSYGNLWNGFVTPVVTRETLERVLADGDEAIRWDGDRVWLGEEPTPFEPNADGLYDTAFLGWTFLEQGYGDDPEAEAPAQETCSCGHIGCRHPGVCGEPLIDGEGWNGLCASCAELTTPYDDDDDELECQYCGKPCHGDREYLEWHQETCPGRPDDDEDDEDDEHRGAPCSGCGAEPGTPHATECPAPGLHYDTPATDPVDPRTY